MIITEETYVHLLRQAAEFCAEDQSDQAFMVLTGGGIPEGAAREKIARMMAARDEIRKNLALDRELIEWRDQTPDGKRCIVLTTNGTTPAETALEVEYIWKNVVKTALERTEYKFVFRQGMELSSPLAVQAVGRADLLVLILTQQEQELGWIVSRAQTLDTRIVPLAAKGLDLGVKLALTSAPVHYNCRRTERGIEVDDANALIATVRDRIISSDPTDSQSISNDASIYKSNRDIYREPLRVLQARYLRNTIYREKLRSLHQLHLGLGDALKRLLSDYELEQEANAETLSPFSEILREIATTFQNDYQCLHQAMQGAASILPESQREEGLKVCDAMKALLQTTLDFIEALQASDTTALSMHDCDVKIENIDDKIRKCCQLIPDREMLVKLGKPILDDPLIVSIRHNMEVFVRKPEVEAIFKMFIERSTVENAKAFCRAIRSALLRWLSLDRRAPGSYDEPARAILAFGVEAGEKAAILENAFPIDAAIRKHVAQLKERLDVPGEERAITDYDALVEFVGDCR